MAKQLKINIKNTQIAKAVHLGQLKEKIASKVESTSEPLSAEVKKAKKSSSAKESSASMLPPSAPAAEEAPRIKARSKSVFEGTPPPEAKAQPLAQATTQQSAPESAPLSLQEEAKQVKIQAAKRKEGEERRSALFAQEIEPQEKRSPSLESPAAFFKEAGEVAPTVPIPSSGAEARKELLPPPSFSREVTPKPLPASSKPVEPLKPLSSRSEPVPTSSAPPVLPTRLGPTGRHIKDLLPPKRPPQPQTPPPGPRQETRFRPDERRERPDFRGRSSFGQVGEARPQGERPPYSSPRAPFRPSTRPPGASPFPHDRGPRPLPRLRPLPPTPVTDLDKQRLKPRVKPHEGTPSAPSGAADKKPIRSGVKGREVKPAKKEEQRGFDTRDRQGLRGVEDEGAAWRKRRAAKHRFSSTEETTIRPTSLKIRLPISIKDLAVEMKLKASQLIQKLFMQNVIVTLNDLLEDETTVQLLGHEFGCEISIDTAEEQRLRITDKSVTEEIALADPDKLVVRPPVVAFMGHVDHGKTSLIDAIRKSNRVAGEAGAITQHIGAFRCHTAVGDLAILDTPGHEAFFAMRARGADVTDIVVLVVAGDEGIKQQTLEAIQHAKAANVTLVVAINKADKPNFNAENIYRQLAEQDLLPEVWGGQIITVNCSATTGEGIPQLLEMLALQSEVLELRASPQSRARGRVLESEMHKGMGAVATVLVQNGTLKLGDALVFASHWGRIKTMRDEHGRDLKEAGPSTPVAITGISGLPEAGEEFIVVKSEREARAIAEDRQTAELRQHGLRSLQKKKVSMENLLQQASVTAKKTLRLILRADVQGSLEAMKTALQKIHSEKVELDIIYAGIGEISESDAQRAAASKAVILGFHTAVESHADPLLRQLGVSVRLHDIIYHAIDDVKSLMVQLLDKIAIETERGKAEVRATFKSSQVGVIAGCQVIEGSIIRNHQMRVRRGKELLWTGSIQSLKRVKEDVREVQKGIECGILLNGFSAFEVSDILEAYEITYITQQL